MFKRNALAVSLTLAALCTAQAAMADLNGGGATLPQALYQTSGVLTAGFAPYIGVGSGAGKAAFLNNDYTKFVAGTTGKNVHWAGSDSKLTATELSDYSTAHGAAWGPLIQVPSVATSVAIPFNLSGGNSVDLTVDQLCGVFSGRLTNWSSIVPGVNKPIQVIYRKASSGTTELFTRFLNAKCTGEAGTFKVTTLFAESYSKGLPGNAYSTDQNPEATDVARADTSPGVMQKLNDFDGRVTYMSPDFAAGTLAGLDDATKVAKIGGLSPAPANVSAAIAAVAVPDTTVRADQNRWVPVFGPAGSADPSVVAYPTSGYPILGFTNLVFSQCYADATQTSQVRTFFNRHYGAVAALNNDAAITANRFVTLPTAWKTAIRDTFVTASSAQSIGNTSVCNAIGRPL